MEKISYERLCEILEYCKKLSINLEKTKYGSIVYDRIKTAYDNSYKEFMMTLALYKVFEKEEKIYNKCSSCAHGQFQFNLEYKNDPCAVCIHCGKGIVDNYKSMQTDLMDDIDEIIKKANKEEQCDGFYKIPE